MKTKTRMFFAVLGVLLVFPQAFAMPGSNVYRYAVVIKQGAYGDAGWKRVADTLVKIHGTWDSKLFIWNSAVTEVKAALSAYKPDYIAFVARPVVDNNTPFIQAAHQFVRDLDTDPYADAVWSIVTGFEANDAVRAVTDTVLVRTGVISHQKSDFGGYFDPTPWPGHRCLTQQISQSEGGSSYPNSYYYFANGRRYTANSPVYSEPDRIVTISNWLNADSIHVVIPGQGEIHGTFDMLSTAGHGNINAWQAQYPSALVEGFLKSRAGGQLYGAPIKGGEILINSRAPRIYCAAGNCLIGTPDSIGNMVYAWFHTGRAVNMFGYIVNSGYGYNGWGDLGRFMNFAGAYNLPECFFITMESMLYDLNNATPGTIASELQLYQNNVVMYGDPKAHAYSVNFGDSARVYLETLVRKRASGTGLDTFTYTLVPNHFALQGNFDFYRSIRPFKFLPARIDPQSVVIERNDGWKACITENFMLWDLIRQGETVPMGATRILQWRAKVIEDLTSAQASAEPLTREIPWMKVGVSKAAGTIGVSWGGLTGDKVEVGVYALNGACAARGVFSGNGKACVFGGEKRLAAGVYGVVVKAGEERIGKRGTVLGD